MIANDCASGKDIYPSRAWAERFAESIRLEHGRRVYVYECKDCGGFHHSKTKPWNLEQAWLKTQRKN